MTASKGVIFDAFGTLVKIHDGTHPYRQILKLGIKQGRRPRPDDIQTIMSGHVGLRDAAKLFGIEVDQGKMIDLELMLDRELASIEPFKDGLMAVRMLQDAGYQVAVCSNLALPYGAVVDRLFPTLDGYGYSFEVGSMKPDRAIYVATADQMSLDLDQCVMIGDSLQCDRDGPIAHGIHGNYLNRDGHGDFADLVTFAETILAMKGA